MVSQPGLNVVASVQKSLEASSTDELHQYMAEDNRLDLSAAWTAASQGNDSTRATTICKLIAQILHRTDDDQDFTSTGCAFIRRILSSNHRQIVRNLSSLRPMYVNPTLRLLITMATFDVGTVANEVYLSLDLGTNKTLSKLLTYSGKQTQEAKVDVSNPRKRKREDGVAKNATRELFVELLLKLLQHCPATVQVEILQHRPIMIEFIKHMMTDTNDLIVKAVNTFSTMYKSQDIARTTKLQFFSEHSKMMSGHYVRVCDEITSLQDEVELQEEETTMIVGDGAINIIDNNDLAETLAQKCLIERVMYDFFHFLTTSPGQGICFESRGLVPPPNKKLYNPILGAFIMNLQPIKIDSHNRLLRDILEATPELIAHWSQLTDLDFSPRLDQEWIASMQFMQSLIEFSWPDDTHELISVIPDFVLLENTIPTTLSKIGRAALQHDEDLIKLMACRTFSASMDKVATLKSSHNRCMDILDKIQKRMPLVEYIFPLASTVLDESSSESDILLRSQALHLLSQYVCIFDDLPRFDFVTLFLTIMNEEASSGQSRASLEEQEAVLRMLPHIADLQWLAKRKESKSIFRIMVEHVLKNPATQAQAYRRALFDFLESETFAFAGLVETQAPLRKSEALVRPLEDGTIESQQSIEFLDFLEDCVGRFFAAPVKYWEMFIDFCAAHDLHVQQSSSPIMMAIREQCQFASKNRPDVADLYSLGLDSILTALISVGDDRQIYQCLIGNRPLPEVKKFSRTTTFEATGVALALRKKAFSSDQDEDYWRLLTRAMLEIPSSDRHDFNQFVIDVWSENVDFSIPAANHILQTLTTTLGSDAIQKYRHLLGLIRRLLLRARLIDSTLDQLLSSQTALMLIKDISTTETSVSTSIKAALLDCVSDGKYAVEFTTTMVHFLKEEDFRHSDLASAVARAIDRSVLVNFPLERFISTTKQLDKSNHETFTATAQCIVAYIRASRSDLPATIIAWTSDAPFRYVTGIVCELLQSTSQELREIGRQILSQHTIVLRDLLSISLSEDVLLCIREKASIDQEAQADMFQDLLDSSVSLNNVFDEQGRNTLTVLLTLHKGSHFVYTEIQSKQMRTLHQQMIDQLRKQFAEQRLQEGKSLSLEVLRYLPIAASYIASTEHFVEDISKSSLDVLVDVALENQSQHAEVFALLSALVSSTKAQAFNYIRTLQAILAQEIILVNPDTKSAAIHLLHLIISHEPKHANIDVIDKILQLYRGSLSRDDLRMFDMLKLLEVALQVPLGSRIKSWRLSESERDESAGRKTVVDVVLTSDLALQTIYRFREYDSAEPQSSPQDAATGSKQLEQDDIATVGHVYDIRWTLSLINGFISTDPSAPMLESLLSHHALGLALISLSSQHRETRVRGSQLLATFRDAIRSSNVRAKTQLLVLFDVLTASLTDADLRDHPLPLLCGVFLALSADILTRPTHFLYAQVNRFLLARPDLDFSDIPLFLDLFYAGKGYAKRVQWLLRFLSAGVRPGEGGAYARRHVLESCMGLYHAKTATPKIKDAISELLQKCKLDFGGYWNKVGGDAWEALASE